MRNYGFAATAWLLITAGSHAQTVKDDFDQSRREAAQAQREVERLQQQFGEQASNYRRSQGELSAAADRFNGQVRSVRNDGQLLDLQTQIANNVISLRKKDDFDKWLAQKRQEWSVSEEFGYRRIREVNGLDGSTYQRFYDKDGNLMVTQFRGYYDNLQREREDWAKARQRAADSSDQIERQYQDLVKQYGSVAASQSALAGARSEAHRRLDQFQSLNRQRVTEEERKRQQETADEYFRRYGSTRPGYAR